MRIKRIEHQDQHFSRCLGACGAIVWTPVQGHAVPEEKPQEFNNAAALELEIGVELQPDSD